MSDQQETTRDGLEPGGEGTPDRTVEATWGWGSGGHVTSRDEVGRYAETGWVPLILPAFAGQYWHQTLLSRTFQSTGTWETLGF